MPHSWKKNNSKEAGSKKAANGGFMGRPRRKNWNKWTKEQQNAPRYKNYGSKYRNNSNHHRGSNNHHQINEQWDPSAEYRDSSSFFVDTNGDQTHQKDSSGSTTGGHHTYFNIPSALETSDTSAPYQAWSSDLKSFIDPADYWREQSQNYLNSGDDSVGAIQMKSSSPLLGTEEYNQLKIQEVSEQIKLKLLDDKNETGSVTSRASVDKLRKDTNKDVQVKTKKSKGENKKSSTKTSKKPTQYNVEEIHSKIIQHLSNMSLRKKMSLINSSSSGLYDVAIQKIQKQQRLELSKALRNMCTDQSAENADAINSIIPDLDIKIENLPLEVIKELSNTLDLDFSLRNLDDDLTINISVPIKQESSDLYMGQDEHRLNPSTIKSEHVVNEDDDDDDDDDDDIEIIEMSSSDDDVEEIVEVKKEQVKTVSIRQLKDVEICNCRSDLNASIAKMNEIDGEIDRLTKLRRSLYDELAKSQKCCQNSKPPTPTNNMNLGKILVIKYVQDELIAASENGQLYVIDLPTFDILKQIDVSTTPITSLAYKSNKACPSRLFVGCLETNLKEYNLETKEITRTIPLSGSIQCLEVASWNSLFIGCTNGFLARISINRSKLEFEDRISDTAIMVLKSTKEGARRVLIISERDAPVTIRDASTFLYLRTMEGLTSLTVYSLLLENSLIYCGTTAHDILIYSFHAGHLIRKHHATDSKGVSCLKIVENLLFASCYNGKIFVYDTKPHKMIGTIDGPGGVILTMEIVENLKQKNTTSPSKEYRTLVPAFLALTLLQNEEVVDFSLFSDGSASKSFAFSAELADGSEIKKIVMVKYHLNEGKKLQIRCFELDTGKYAFSQSYHNYLKYQPVCDDYDFVMYTNCVFGMSSKKKSSAFSADGCSLLNTSADSKKSVVQFQNSEIWEKYGDFLDYFYVYHSQKNGDCMREEINEQLTKFGCSESSIKKYLSLFEKARKGNAVEVKKSDIITLLFNLNLGPNALQLKSTTEIDILNELFARFDLTTLDGLDYDHLKQFSVKSPEIDDGLLIRRPLVINVDDNSIDLIRSLLKLCRHHRNPLMLVMTGSFSELNFDNLNIFKKLSDLKEIDKELHHKILDNFCMTLQGVKALEKVQLRQLFNISEGMVDVFTATDLLKMLEDS